MVKLYGLIATHADLGSLEQKALELDKHAVGVTKSGKLYKYESRTRHAIEIAKEEAASILECSIDEINSIIDTKGKYLLKAIVDEEEQTTKETLEPAEANSPDRKENSVEIDTDDEYKDEEYEDENSYTLQEAVEDTAAVVDDAVSELKENNDANSDKILTVLESIHDLLKKLVDAIVLD